MRSGPPLAFAAGFLSGGPCAKHPFPAGFFFKSLPAAALQSFLSTGVGSLPSMTQKHLLLHSQLWMAHNHCQTGWPTCLESHQAQLTHHLYTSLFKVLFLDSIDTSELSSAMPFLKPSMTLACALSRLLWNFSHDFSVAVTLLQCLSSTMRLSAHLPGSRAFSQSGQLGYHAQISS